MEDEERKIDRGGRRGEKRIELKRCKNKTGARGDERSMNREKGMNGS